MSETCLDAGFIVINTEANRGNGFEITAAGISSHLNSQGMQGEWLFPSLSDKLSQIYHFDREIPRVSSELRDIWVKVFKNGPSKM